MATAKELLAALQRQQQILNEMARLSCLIEQALRGKLAESEKALKGDYHEPVQAR